MKTIHGQYCRRASRLRVRGLWCEAPFSNTCQVYRDG
jgi:hypothetical protein